MLENKIKELKTKRITIEELNEVLKLFDKETTVYYHCKFKTECCDWIYNSRHDFKGMRIYLMNTVKDTCVNSFKNTNEALEHLEHSLELIREWEEYEKEFEEMMLS